MADTSFKITRLWPGCVVLRDVRLGASEPALSIDQAEARFSLPELLNGQLGRLRLRGVRSAVVVDGLKVSSPLQARLLPLVEKQRAQHAGQTRAEPRKPFAVGEVSVYDIQVPVRLPDGRELATLRCDTSIVSEPSAGNGREQYRVWASVQESNGVMANFAGTLEPASGALSVSSDIKVKSVEALLGRVRLAVPEQLSRMSAFPTNCSLALRGVFSATAWTNVGPFEATAELGRGSVLMLRKPDGIVRFQTLRVEASGTPQDVQCRLSVGIAGLRIGDAIQASQEEGRLLSMRGSGRFVQTPSNCVVRATMDSDLPGRSVAQVLPKVLPLVSRLMTEGGTFHAEAVVAKEQKGLWQGEARYSAEARRNAVTVPAGRMGASRVAVAGVLQISDAKPAQLSTEITLEEGYCVRPGLNVRGGFQASLLSAPPYTSATGEFSGQVNETASVPKTGVVLPNGGIRFGGRATVDGLVTNPLWRLSLQAPEFEVASQRGGATWRATAGGEARVRYGVDSLSLDGSLWARDGVAAVTASGAVGRAEAGLGRLEAHVAVAGANPADPSNLVVHLALDASNVWARAGTLLSLEQARVQVPFDWSLAKGPVFRGQSQVTWQRLESEGLRMLPDELKLETRDAAVEGSFGARVADSRLGVKTTWRVPLDDPKQMVIEIAVPETDVAEDDAVSSAVRSLSKGAVFAGRVSAEASVRFLGSQPHVLGRLRMTDGRVRHNKLEVEGIAADVPFESSVLFRTIERPRISFARAKAGHVLLDHGSVAFQLTPQELFVDRMEVGLCKGSLNAYSVHLALKHPKDEFVVYADRIDLGEALMMVLPFKGKMEGVLYGRFPVGFDNGHVRLSTGFLYSLPGQGGKLKMDAPDQMASLLDNAGIKGEVQVPLSKALSDIDFKTLKLDLEPQEGGDGMVRIKLVGQSNDKEWPAPVDLNLNVHAPLEELVNMGLDMSRK